MIEKVKEIKNKLKHSWNPFFSRYGRLTEIQIETIPYVLNGKNVLVISPTASGKTEAIVSPVVEKLIQQKWDKLSTIYITPTKALANDIFHRLENPLRDMNIILEIKHGDKGYLSKKNISNFLITTPESLDSMICRKTSIFKNLKTIIIDEIHFLDNSYRGDQLRFLIWRLKEVVDKDFNIHILSATIPNPEELGKRYVNNFEVIKIKGERKINFKFLCSHDEIYNLSRKNKWKKVLYFCNSRKKVESIVSLIEKIWSPYPVLAHHGSLSRQNREEAENILKNSNIVVGVATSTLEIGIDIGNIDVVVLADIPWSLSSFMQRIGRANRKQFTINLICLISKNKETEETVYRMMIKAALNKYLSYDENYIPDISVIIQQIFSYLFQNKIGIPENKMYNLLSKIFSKQDIIQNQISKDTIDSSLSLRMTPPAVILRA